MKKLIALLLIITSLFFIVSCGDENRKYNEEEVIEAAERLIPKSKKLNDIFWGYGIRYIEDDNYKNGVYYPADQLHLTELGYDSVDEIISAMTKVYSISYARSIASAVFSSTVGTTGSVGLVRYYQEKDILMVYGEYNQFLYDDVNYLTDSIKVLGSKGKRVQVEISVEITDSDTKEAQTREIKFYLVEEADGWRIDSPTYASYQHTKK